MTQIFYLNKRVRQLRDEMLVDSVKDESEGETPDAGTVTSGLVTCGPEQLVKNGNFLKLGLNV